MATGRRESSELHLRPSHQQRERHSRAADGAILGVRGECGRRSNSGRDAKFLDGSGRLPARR